MGTNGVSSDAIHYSYRTLSGDGSIVARIANQNTVQPWYFDSTDGVMIRESLDQGSKFAMMGISYKNGPRLTYRTETGAVSQATPAAQPGPLWVKLVRSGNKFTGYQSQDGNTWIQVGSQQTISMASKVYVGLSGDSYTPNAVHMAVVDHVKLSPSDPSAAATPNPPSPSCARANPLLTLSAVSSLPALPGGGIAYQVQMVDTDSAICGAGSYDISLNMPAGLNGNLDRNFVVLQPGESTVLNLQVNSTAGIATGTYPISATAVLSGDSSVTTTAALTFSVQIPTPKPTSCVRNNPIVSLIPVGSQSTSKGGSVSYQIVTTSTDTAGCDSALYNLFLHLPTGFQGIQNTQAVWLNPGATIYSDLELIVPAAASSGDYSFSVDATLSGNVTIVTSTSGQLHVF
jgi:hypothetical protein